MRGLGRLSIACGLALMGLLVSGCGAESDQEKIRQTVTTYNDAYLAGETERACEQLTPISRRVVGLVVRPDGARCAEDLRYILEGNFEASVGRKDLKLGRIEVDGDHATVALEPPKVFERLSLTKGEGEWKIDLLATYRDEDEAHYRDVDEALRSALDPAVRRESERKIADTDVQDRIRAAVTGLETCFAKTQDYSACEDTLRRSDPGAGEVELRDATDHSYTLASRSSSGNVFFVRKKTEFDYPSKACTRAGRGACRPGGTW